MVSVVRSLFHVPASSGAGLEQPVKSAASEMTMMRMLIVPLGACWPNTAAARVGGSSAASMVHDGADRLHAPAAIDTLGENDHCIVRRMPQLRRRHCAFIAVRRCGDRPDKKAEQR